MDFSSFEDPEEEDEESADDGPRISEFDAPTALLPIPRAVKGAPSPKSPLKHSLAPDPSLPHFASSASPNYFSPKSREKGKFDETKPKMYGKLLALLLVIPIFFLSNAVPMEGFITSFVIYICFYLYGYTLNIQQLRRRKGKRGFNWFQILVRSPWWTVKILIRMLPAALLWFFGLLFFNWLLSFGYPSVKAGFLGSRWSMGFVNFPPRSWGGLVLGLWALACWMAMIFTRLGTRSAVMGFNFAYRSIYRGIRHLKDEEGAGLVNRDAYLHPASARCGIILLILLGAFLLASLTVYLALGGADWGPIFIARL